MWGTLDMIRVTHILGSSSPELKLDKSNRSAGSNSWLSCTNRSFLVLPLLENHNPLCIQPGNNPHIPINIPQARTTARILSANVHVPQPLELTPL